MQTIKNRKHIQKNNESIVQLYILYSNCPGNNLISDVLLILSFKAPIKINISNKL